MAFTIFHTVQCGAIYQKQNDLITGCFPLKTANSPSLRYFPLVCL